MIKTCRQTQAHIYAVLKMVKRENVSFRLEMAILFLRKKWLPGKIMSAPETEGRKVQGLHDPYGKIKILRNREEG